MARIRTIKPDFWTDGNMVRRTPWARLFYIGMWNFALCDSGHLKDDPSGLKLQILPADDVDPDALLMELIDAGRVVRILLSDGRSFLHIPRLRDHQKVDDRWSPRCPVCAELHPNSPDPGQTHGNSREGRGDSPRKGKEGKGEKTPSTASRSRPVDDPRFASFWAAYPRKVGKGEARKSWAKAIKAGATAEAVIHAAEVFAKSNADTEPRFVVHPATWLNQERWDDEPPSGRLRMVAAVGGEYQAPAPPLEVMQDSDPMAIPNWFRKHREDWESERGMR